MRLEPMRLALFGFGNVGAGFARVLERHLRENDRLDEFVIRGLANSRGARLFDQPLLVSQLSQWQESKHTPLSPEQLLVHDEVDVIVESMPTNIDHPEPAMSYHRLALNAGKHVITANKGPASKALTELRHLALANRVYYGYEATVMSGTPCIHLIESLKPAGIEKISGILNGTTNYILSQMDNGLSYERALSLATELGYAEPDPSSDVDGLDIQAKVFILAQHAFGYRPAEVITASIRDQSSQELKLAKEEGCRIKLIGEVTAEGASVKKAKLAAVDPLSQIEGATNAITIVTKSLGTITMKGPGAGSDATGMGLLMDLQKAEKL